MNTTGKPKTRNTTRQEAEKLEDLNNAASKLKTEYALKIAQLDAFDNDFIKSFCTETAELCDQADERRCAYNVDVKTYYQLNRDATAAAEASILRSRAFRENPTLANLHMLPAAKTNKAKVTRKVAESAKGLMEYWVAEAAYVNKMVKHYTENYEFESVNADLHETEAELFEKNCELQPINDDNKENAASFV